MELILTIQKSDVPEQRGTSFRFQEGGGTIGRSPRNDWVVSDPERFVSERHARIAFEGGQFILTDLSTNGTYLNDDDRRIAKNHSVALRAGDRLYMGNLRIGVEIMDDQGNRLGQAGGGTQLRERDRGLTHRQRRPASDRPGPADARARRGSRGSGAGARAGQPEIPEEWHNLLPGFHESSRDGGAGRRDGNRGSVETSGEVVARTILEELGIEDAIGDVDLEAFGHEVGRILRMVAEGLMQSLRQRAEVKNKFRVDQTQIRAAGNNPLKTSPDLESALRRLFTDSESGTYMQGAPAFREAFQDLNVHELAILSAVHASIESVIGSFDPRPLKEKLRQIAPVSSATPVLGNAKCWSLYEEHYKSVANQLLDDARLGFLKEFSKAYESATKRLRRRRASDRAEDRER